MGGSARHRASSSANALATSSGHHSVTSRSRQSNVTTEWVFCWALCTSNSRTSSRVSVLGSLVSTSKRCERVVRGPLAEKQPQEVVNEGDNLRRIVPACFSCRYTVRAKVGVARAGGIRVRELCPCSAF
jgi:hypothetical protein